MALLGILTGGLDAISSLAGSSDPTRDKERIARLDRAANLAIMGDTRPVPEFEVDGVYLSGFDYLQEIAENSSEAGSSTAQTYAKVRLVEVKARLQTGGALADVGVAATGAADTLAPGTGLRAFSKALTGSVGGISSIVLLAGIGVVVWLLIRRK